MKFEVIVGNIGTVYNGHDESEAYRRYDEYVSQSLQNYGRAAGESVILIFNNEIIKEHYQREVRDPNEVE